MVNHDTPFQHDLYTRAVGISIFSPNGVQPIIVISLIVTARLSPCNCHRATGTASIFFYTFDLVFSNGLGFRLYVQEPPYSDAKEAAVSSDVLRTRISRTDRSVFSQRA